MSIEKRIERIEAILDARGLDWDYPRVEDEPAKPPEPEYREPVLPADAGKECEFSPDGEAWGGGLLGGWSRMFWISDCGVYSRFARIKKDA
jgi:hypothetical protein